VQILFVIFTIFISTGSFLAVFGLGLLFIAWLFRHVEPDRWRRMSTRPVFNTVISLLAVSLTTANFWLIPGGRMDLLVVMVTTESVGLLVMAFFFGSSSTKKRKAVDPEI
jgi:hypothetical protein